MNIKAKAKLVAMVLTLAAILFNMGANDASAERKIVKADGSSTVFPISEAVAEEFQKTDKNVMVTVGLSGTGGGFKKFCTGETDISNASRPIKATEMELCKKNNVEYIELPVAFDGLAVMVNPKNTWVDHFTVAELKKIWEPEAQGNITKWSQVRKGWPDKEIRLFGPGVDSGTFDYFTQAINGKEKASRGDYTASEDDNILVQGISTDPNSLGHFGIAYYEHNKGKLKLVPIDDGYNDNGRGPILPSEKTINNATYQPLSRPLLIYVSKKSLEKPEVAGFIAFYIKNAAALSKEVGYVPLSKELYELAAARVTKKKTGTIFGGSSQVKVKLENLLKGN
ncbi:MAG: PstS family phosphate ABC transporter substrate-binding protein [Thermodesulfobacteriota bacterium]